MSPTTIPALTSPEQIGVVRQLLTAMNNAGYRHLIYQFGDGPIEHNWRTRDQVHEVALVAGQLTYTRSMRRVVEADVDSPQRAARLLAAYDVIPPVAAAAVDPTGLHYDRDDAEPAGLPIPAGADGRSISGRDGGAR